MTFPSQILAQWSLPLLLRPEHILPQGTGDLQLLFHPRLSHFWPRGILWSPQGVLVKFYWETGFPRGYIWDLGAVGCRAVPCTFLWTESKTPDGEWEGKAIPVNSSSPSAECTWSRHRTKQCWREHKAAKNASKPPLLIHGGCRSPPTAQGDRILHFPFTGGRQHPSPSASEQGKQGQESSSIDVPLQLGFLTLLAFTQHN